MRIGGGGKSSLFWNQDVTLYLLKKDTGQTEAIAYEKYNRTIHFLNYQKEHTGKKTKQNYQLKKKLYKILTFLDYITQEGSKTSL